METVQLRRLGPTSNIVVLKSSKGKTVWYAGRGSSCQIYTKSKFASRNHFSITCNSSNQYFLSDLGSANGTFLNDKKLVIDTILEFGDIISVGVPSNTQDSADCIVYVFERCLDENVPQKSLNKILPQKNFPSNRLLENAGNVPINSKSADTDKVSSSKALKNTLTNNIGFRNDIQVPNEVNNQEVSSSSSGNDCTKNDACSLDAVSSSSSSSSSKATDENQTNGTDQPIPDENQTHVTDQPILDENQMNETDQHSPDKNQTNETDQLRPDKNQTNGTDQSRPDESQASGTDQPSPDEIPASNESDQNMDENELEVNDEISASCTIDEIMENLNKTDDGVEQERENSRNENRMSIDEDEDIFSGDNDEEDEAYNVCTQIDEIKKEYTACFSVCEEVIEISDSEDENWSQSMILSQQQRKTNLEEEEKEPEEEEEDYDDEIQFLESLPSTHVFHPPVQIKEEVIDEIPLVEIDDEEDLSEIDRKWFGKLAQSQEYKEFKTKVEVIDDLDEEEQEEIDKDEDGAERMETIDETEKDAEELSDVPEVMDVSPSSSSSSSSSSDEDAVETEDTDVTSSSSSKSLSTDENLAVPGPSSSGSQKTERRSHLEKNLLSPRRSPRRISQEDIFEPTVGSPRFFNEGSKSPKTSDIHECYVKLDRINLDQRNDGIQLPQSPMSPRSPVKCFSPKTDEPDFLSGAELDSMEKVVREKQFTSSKASRRIISDDESDSDEDYFVQKKAKMIGIDELPPMISRRERQKEKKHPFFGEKIQKIRKKAMPPSGNISPSAKAKIISQRKNKLKALNKPKGESEYSTDPSLIRPKVQSTTLKVKNTTKSRGDFLCDLGVQNISAREVKKKVAKPFPIIPISNLISTAKYPPPEKVDSQKKSDLADVQKENDFAKALLVADTVLVEKVHRVSSLKTSALSKTNEISHPAAISLPDSSTSEREQLPHSTTENSAASIATTTRTELKGILKLIGCGFMRGNRPMTPKKRVVFNDAKNRIKLFEVEDEKAVLRKLKAKKEPVSKEHLINQGAIRFKNIIFNICNWNTRWLDECKSVPADLHPPIFPSNQESAKILPKRFSSHSQYMRSVIPLLLLDLWTSISNRWKTMESFEPRYIVACSSYEYSPKDDITNNLSIIDCEGILPGSGNGNYIKEQDLVVVQIAQASDDQPSTQDTLSQGNSKKKVYNCFGYVLKRNMEKIIPQVTSVHPALVNLCLSFSNENHLCKFKIILKRRNYLKVDTQKPMTLTVVQNIKSELTLFKAVCSLPKSPLCDTILAPNRPNLTLANPSKRSRIVFNKPLDAIQQDVVLKLATTCFKSSPSLHQIQGGPGTGKSYLMIAAILQLLFGEEGKDFVRPKIIYCTHSNAAIDEVALALSRYRQEMDKSERFKLVRVGHLNFIKPEVRDISSQYLALQNEKKNKVEEEKKIAQNQIDKLVEDLGKYGELSKSEIDEKSAELNNWFRKKLSIEQGKYDNPVTQASWEAECLIIEKADIICTTCIQSGLPKITRVFNKIAAEGKNRRIVCIIDEAMQSREVETLIPLFLGVTNLILVGDLYQLKPPVRSKKASELGVGHSLFRRIWSFFYKTKENISPIVNLKTQYRMNPSIADFPDRTFYNNQLRTASCVTNRIKNCNFKPYVILMNDENAEIPEGERESREGKIVQLLLKIMKQSLSKNKEENVTIAVIASHLKQANYLKFRLKETYSNVEINAVDRFQGTEFNIVIFLNDGSTLSPDQMNLALTRAKDSLIVAVLSNPSKKISDQFKKLLEDGTRRNVVRNLSRHITEEELARLLTN